jgi:hypothetical protein
LTGAFQRRCPLRRGGDERLLIEKATMRSPHACRKEGQPIFNTQMGKGSVGGASDLYRGTATLCEHDYVHRAID